MTTTTTNDRAPRLDEATLSRAELIRAMLAKVERMAPGPNRTAALASIASLAG